MAKRSISIAAFIVIVLIIIILAVGNSRGTSGETLRIGVVSFPTGPAAAFAEISLGAIEIAIDDINREGGIGGKRVEAVLEDYAYDPKRAIPAYQKLALQGIKFFFIDGSAAIASIGPIVRQEGNFSIVPSATLPAYKDGSPLTCRISLTADTYAPTMAKYIADNYPNPRVAFLMPSNDYGLSLQEGIEEEIVNLGGSIVAKENFDQAASDFRTSITKLKGIEKNFDVLVVSNISNTVEPFFKQIRELGLSKPMISENWTAMNPQLKDLSLENGIIYADYSYSADPNEADSEEVSSFKRAYFDRHGQYPPPHAANSYDSIMIVARALHEAPEQTPESVSDFLINDMGRYQGVSGSFSFNDDCEVDRDITFRTVIDGKVSELK